MTRIALTEAQKALASGMLIPSGDSAYFDTTQTTPLTSTYPSPSGADSMIETHEYPVTTSGEALIGLLTENNYNDDDLTSSGFVYDSQTVVNTNNVNGFDITRINYRDYE